MINIKNILLVSTIIFSLKGCLVNVSNSSTSESLNSSTSDISPSESTNVDSSLTDIVNIENIEHLKNLLSLLLPHSMTIPWKQLLHQNLSISPTQKCKRNSFKTKSLPPFFFLLPSPFNSLFIFPLLFQGNCMGF